VNVATHDHYGKTRGCGYSQGRGRGKVQGCGLNHNLSGDHKNTFFSPGVKKCGKE